MKKGKIEPHVLYSGDGKGNWIKREWQNQCPEKVFLRDSCQGVEGHKGEHWCYGPNGSYHWEHNKIEPPDPSAAAGSIPPDHESYISPKEKSKEYYMNFYVDSKVTSLEKIASLNRGECEDGASLTAPVPPEELKRLKDAGILLD